MKQLSFVLLFLALTAPLPASVIGWLTSEACDWKFLQSTGGIRVDPPIEKEGKSVLPIEYYVQGLVAITCQPTALNSGLAVRRIEAKEVGAQIIIRVFTQLVEKGSDTGRIHYADLSEIPPGKYDVFYETPNDMTKYLGRIEIKDLLEGVRSQKLNSERVAACLKPPLAHFCLPQQRNCQALRALATPE